MCDKDNCNCGSNPCCDECEPWNCVEQAVNDVWATKETQIEGLVQKAEDAADRSEDAADRSEDAASAAAGSASEAKGYRDEAEQAATTAVAAEGTVIEVAGILQETGEALRRIANQLEDAIAGITVIPYYYTIETNKQTVIVLPAEIKTASVQAIYVDGLRQEPGVDRGFTYVALTRTITLASGLPKGLEIVIMLGTYNADNPDDFSHTLASNNGASLVGTSEGITVQEKLNDLDNQDYNLSGVTLAMLPRLMAKLSSYRHGIANYQTEYRVWGFGSSVGNGATIGGNGSAFTPVAKFFEFLNNTVNRMGLYPFTLSNKSVDGSSINDFLVRDWAAATASGVYPDLAVFAYGMNDFPTALYNGGATFGENGFKERLRKAIRLVKSAGGDVVLTTTPHPHSQRQSWSMPASVSQAWPIAVAAPVADESLTPPVSKSLTTFVWKGVSITAAIRFLRGNDAIRQVAIEEGCVLVDIEKFWWDAVALYGEDALFNTGQSVHPNYKGHELSYQRGFKLFFDAMDNNALVLPSPARYPTLTVGGTALYPQPALADVDMMAIGQKAIAFIDRDQFARPLNSLAQNGELTKTSYTSQTPTTSSPGYSLNWIEFFTRTKGLFSANEQLTISIPNRTSKKVIIDAWSSAQTGWAQFVELMITNREGVITYTIMGNHDQTPPAGGGSGSPTTGGSRLFTLSTGSDSLIITALVDLTSLKYRITGFGV